MTPYILQLFFWTQEDGEKAVDLVGQYRIYAVDKDAACVVAATVLDHEPLLDYADSDEIDSIAIDLEHKPSTEG